MTYSFESHSYTLLSIMLDKILGLLERQYLVNVIMYSCHIITFLGRGHFLSGSDSVIFTNLVSLEKVWNKCLLGPNLCAYWAMSRFVKLLAGPTLVCLLGDGTSRFVKLHYVLLCGLFKMLLCIVGSRGGHDVQRTNILTSNCCFVATIITEEWQFRKQVLA
jgi:hypothetical protein